MTRVDHILISVRDLESAMDRWATAGLSATVGGSHPGGTFNALVRGPRRAYVELIGAVESATSETAARVRSVTGPLSWALGVDDLDKARGALERDGHKPGPVHHGSRTTPNGVTLRWRLCDVGPHPLHRFLPFLIEWETDMEPGPQDGPVLTSITLDVPEPLPLSRLLETCGLLVIPGAYDTLVTLADGEVQVVLRRGIGRITSATLRLPGGPSGEVVLDGLLVRRDSNN